MTPHRDWTMAELGRLRSLSENGRTDPEIAAILDRSIRSVRSARRRHGVIKRPAGRSWAAEQIQSVLAMRADGLTIPQLARAHNTTSPSIRYVLHRYGAKTVGLPAGHVRAMVWAGRHRAGESMRAIGLQEGLNESTVWQALARLEARLGFRVRPMKRAA